MGRRRRSVTVTTSVVLLTLVGLTIAGCSAGPPTAPVGPAYTTGAAGSAQVVGYLSRSDLEGGFWAVYDALLSASGAVQPKVLAVLLPGTVNESGIAALNGRYVWASGRGSGDASIRMAGPEILVDAIAVATPPTP